MICTDFYDGARYTAEHILGPRYTAEHIPGARFTSIRPVATPGRTPEGSHVRGGRITEPAERRWPNLDTGPSPTR